MRAKRSFSYLSRCLWKRSSASLGGLVVLQALLIQALPARALDEQENVSISSQAYEQALQLNPREGSALQRLVEIYIAQKAPEKASQALQTAASVVPQDATLRLRYAKLAERSGLANEAERFYKLALEADSKLEAAHFGLAQIFTNRRDLARSLKTIDEGLESNPSSIRLLLLKADVLPLLDRELESRQVLDEAFRLNPNEPDVVAQAVTTRDIHGDRAGEAYEALASALARDNAEQTAVRRALERGLVVSLRDGERDRAVQFAKRLRELGVREVPDLNPSKFPPSKGSAVAVPGGMKGLAVAARMNEDVGAERFVAAYASTISRQTCGRDRDAYLNAIRSYFATLRSLKALATTNGNSTEIVLSSSGKQASDKAETVLKLFGWRLKRSGEKVLLEVGSNESDAVKQPYLAALGVDEIQMKSALESGTPFTLRLTDQQVPVILDEKFWLERVFGETPHPHAGLLEAMLENLGAARLYSSLAQMNDEAQHQVLRVAEPKKLLGRYADLLAAYGAALSVVGGRMMLPGGNDASLVWRQFTGNKPEDPATFINSLLSRDRGKALAFFNLLTNLPPLQQKFFTRSAVRVENFYQAFPFTEKDDLKRHAVVRRDEHFRNLAHELPLDDEGNVRFPGSDQVWRVANGGSSNSSQVSKLPRKAFRKAAPEIEDEILLRLLDTKYEAEGANFNQVENFLAVARLERHRNQPLDEASVLLLSQNYPRYREVFPLFAALPDLSFQQFTIFFEACRNLETLEKPLLNLALGEFESLLQLVVLLSENGALEHSASVAAFASISELFAKAKEPFHFAQASLQSVQNLLNGLNSTQLTTSIEDEGPRRDPAAEPETPDERLLLALTGPAKRVSFRMQENEYAVNRAVLQREKIREVLRLQAATPLETLLRIHNAVSRIVHEQRESLRWIGEIEGTLPGLREVDLHTQKRLPPSVQETISLARPEELLKQVSNLRKEAGRISDRNLSKIASKLLGELNPYLKNSLTAWIYAYYFSPQDLMIAQDPLFVRRHQFFGQSGQRKIYWPMVNQGTYPQSAGMFLRGVLFQLGSMAGTLGAKQVEVGASFNGVPEAERLTHVQIAALRSLPWARLTQSDLHAVGISLRFAREVVVTASLKPAIASEVAKQTIGLIGLARRTELLKSLANHDAYGALKLLSSSDLYFLGERFWLEHGPEKLGDSPMTAAMRQIKSSAAHTNTRYFGGTHLKTFGCVHTHLPLLRPYEDYEKFRLPDDMAERLGHFLLDMAESLDRLGIPIEALAVIGEPFVRELGKNSRMIDRDDWMAVIASAAQIRIPELILTLQSKEGLP